MGVKAHERYDVDERRLVANASEALWTDGLIDIVIDSAMPILDGAQWNGVPEGAPPRWSERSTAILALAAMALRNTRTAALTVRAGYGPEARADLRRLREAAGHANEVASDESGQYAENWLHGRGKAGKPRAAFGSESKDLWKLLSGHAHAEFRDYAHASADLDDGRRIVHHVGPRRDLLWDNVTLWLTARTLTSVLASVLKVHSRLDQDNFLRMATAVVAGEQRLERELADAMTATSDGDTGSSNP